MGRTVAARRLEPTPMSLEAWADMDEDEPGELVDGFLEEEEVPTVLHEAVVSWLIRFLGAWLGASGGWVFGSEMKFAVAAARGRKPDVSVFLGGTPLPEAQASLARVPPSIMVEVVSPRPRDGRRDRIDKLADYAAFGVPYYWLIDPQLRTLEVLALRARRKPELVLSASGGRRAIPGCPGLRLDLDALWAALDKLPSSPAAPPAPARASRPKRLARPKARPRS
ncbi:MAG: Uma2 family endonuclease [Polyangiaceae bacterium]